MPTPTPRQAALAWVRARKHQILLVTLVGLIAFYPVVRGAPGAGAVFSGLRSLVFLAALLVLHADHRLRLLALLLGFPLVFGWWAGVAVPGRPGVAVVVGTHLTGAVYLAVTTGVILRSVYREPVVTADGVCGAFCGYLALGLAFAHIYAAIEAVAPGSFEGAAAVRDRLRGSDDRLFLLDYFSFVTLTTVGYGDITPATDQTRGVAVAEAVTGQFYLAVLVAELIGKRVSQSPPAQTPPADQPVARAQTADLE